MLGWRMLMPGFLGIGAMRAGTSWFAAHLATHPRIRLERKEIHFFDRKLERRRIPFLPTEIEAKLRYGLRFLPAAAGGRIAGDFTPAYGILDLERISRVYDWLPDVKILFIMRDPVERAWSQARHDFTTFRHVAPETVSRAELISFFESPSVRRRGDYAACLTNWMRFFRWEQFFLTFLEDVKSDPTAVLRAAFSFLEVEPDVDLDPGLSASIHASTGTSIPDWVRRYLEDSLRPNDQRLEALIGQRLPWAARRESPVSTPGPRGGS